MRNCKTLFVSLLMSGIVLAIILGLAYWFGIDHSRIPHPNELTKAYSAEEAQAIWATMLPPQETVDIRGIVPGNALEILADVDDDGIIDERDRSARSNSVGEIVRHDNHFCNGRSGVYDRSPSLDDDLQLLVLQLPVDTLESDEFRLQPDAESLKNLVFYKSDLVVDESVIHWPIALSALPFRDTPNHRVFLWLKATDTFADRRTDGAITLALTRNHQELSKDTLGLTIAGGLGDRSFFAGALDYLMERDRRTGQPSTLFLDERTCPSDELLGGNETFRLVLMRHALTEISVIETFYANKSMLRGRINNVFDAIERIPEGDVIVNGSFFHLENNKLNHGRKVLGAVINNHELSPASSYHHWQIAYKESGVSGTPDWHYKSFCLVQPEHRPGCMTFVEEPYIRKEPFVPKVTIDGHSTLPYMALGGLHQVHNFENNTGCNKNCAGFFDVPDAQGNAGDPNRRLIWIASTDTNPQKTTGRYGGPALRQALRGSGVTIEEGDPQHGKGPGRCDMVYFDSANSVALAYKLDDRFEVPSVGGRHLPDAPNTLVNNYLMLRVSNGTQDTAE